MFIKKYEGQVNPFALPGLLNDYKMNLPTSDCLCQLDHIIKVVHEHSGITEQEIKGKCRKREIVVMRQIFCLLAKRHTRNSLKTIGEFIHRDHTTIIHSIETIKDLMETDEEIVSLVIAVDNKLTNTNNVDVLAYKVIGRNLEIKKIV